jgi:hypothetical protein
MTLEMLKDIVKRIAAVFVVSALSVIGAGAVAGVSILQSMMIAGVAGVAAVVETLARSFLNDGELSATEINQAFNAVPDRSRPAPKPVAARPKPKVLIDAECDCSCVECDCPCHDVP